MNSVVRAHALRRGRRARSRGVRRALVGTVAAFGLSAAAWWWTRSRAPYVASWRPSSLPLRTDGRLPARVGGSGDPTFLVLHGVGTTADCFGAGFDRLAEHGRVVMSDLLGFGRAMDSTRDHFDVVDHLEAIDETVRELGSGGPVVVAGHSLGGALALRWAAHNVDQVAGVVAWGPPLYLDGDRARAEISGAMQRAVAIDTDLAAWLCARMCRYRRIAAAIAVASSPTTPSALARQAVLHTWPAYRDALRHVAFDTGWTSALQTLNDRGGPVRLVWGFEDRIGDPDAIAMLTTTMPNVEVVRVPGDHRAPLIDPDGAVDEIVAISNSSNIA